MIIHHHHRLGSIFEAVASSFHPNLKDNLQQASF